MAQAEAALAALAQAETARAGTAQAGTAQAGTAQSAATGPIDVSPHVVRGPFEPLVEAARTSEPDAAATDHGAESAWARPWGDDGDAAVGGTAWSSADEDPDDAPTGGSEYESTSYEFPGLADDDPAESADAALDRLKALHLTAAAVAPQSLDANFDQLLERQRKLISEYLSQTGGPAALAATSTSTSTSTRTTDDDDGSLVGYGDDRRSAR
jgi:hypothetical protein